jgi:hypothetical protein
MDQSFINPFYPKDTNKSAAYGNALVTTGEAILNGAIVVSCFSPTAKVGDTDYRLYICTWTPNDLATPNNFTGPLSPANSVDIPKDQCPTPPVPIIGIVSAYAP